MSTLAKLYDVSAATVQDWKRRGAPVNDPAAMADWVMNEPEVFAGYERAQAVADQLPEMAKRALAAGDTAFASLLMDTLAGWTSSLHCRAFWRAR